MTTAVPISVWYRTGGSWKRVDPPHVRVSGVWKEVTGVWVKVSGVWKRCFADVVGELSLGNVSASAADFFAPYFAEAGVRLQTDGSFDVLANPGIFSVWTEYPFGSWRAYDVGRTYQYYWDNTSGTFDTEPTEDTWIDITAQLQWANTISAEGSKAGVGTLKIREKIGANPDGDDTGVIGVSALGGQA